MIGEFRSIVCVPVFQGSLLVIVILINISEKCNYEGGFELQSSHVFEKRSKSSLIHYPKKIEIVTFKALVTH